MNLIKIYIIAIMGFFVATSQFIIAGILDKIAISANISIANAGQLITAFAISGAICVPFLTLIVSKYSLKNQMTMVIAIFITGIILTAISLKFEILILARAITGIGSIFFVVVSYVLASKLAKKGKDGAAISNIALGFSLSLVFGVPIGRYISNLYNWQMIFYIIFVIVIFGFIILYFIIDNEKSEEVNSIKQQILVIKNKNILLSLMVTVFVFITFSTITTYITPILFSIEKISEHKISAIFLALGLASVIGSKLGASLADKIGVFTILIATIAILILSAILMIFLSFNINYFTIILVIWTISMWMFGPTQSLNLSRLSPKNASILLSLNSSFVQIGFGLGSFLGGGIIEHFEPKAILIFCVISSIIAFILQLKSK